MSNIDVTKNAVPTKEQIELLKSLGSEEIASFLETFQNNAVDLNFILKNFGYLPKDFDCDVFINYLSHQNEKIRYWAVKNIGKSKSLKYLEMLIDRFKTEKSTSVKREYVSAIGRMKSKEAIPFLVSILKDDDPKIVAQAIRGLLVYKGEKNIDEILSNMINHENEMVRAVIFKEYMSNKKENPKKLSHSSVYDYLKNVVVNADVRDASSFLEDESIHLTFTMLLVVTLYHMYTNKTTKNC